METIFQNIAGYINSLDWGYILTFILISYGINHSTFRAFITNGLGITLKTRYRVLIVGVVYGVFIFFIRGYALYSVEILFQSFVFALVFHKLIIELVIERLFPKKQEQNNEYL